MVSVRNQLQFSEDRTDREDFTSDYVDEEILLDEGGKIEELVLKISCESLFKQNEDIFWHTTEGEKWVRRELMDELGHPPRHHATKIQNAITNHDVVNVSLRELQPFKMQF